jgi:two-component system KDP operon response regulator KdpE
MATVLVIDDDTALLAACRVRLRALGHQIRTAATGDAGLYDEAVYPPAVVVLDLGLPDIDGMQVFHQLRGWTQTPVIILSADGSEDRKVEALNGGADDYVTNPFGMRELDARLRVALRHHATDQAEPITQLDVGPLTLDLLQYEASYRGERIDLTPKEFDFLAYLARHVGKVCTRRMILESIWGPGYINEHHYLKVHAYLIRTKLHDEQVEFLQNDPSVGYRLAVHEADIGRYRNTIPASVNRSMIVSI